MKSAERKKKFEEGLAHFNAKKFFEAHEFWEEIWLVEPEPEKDLPARLNPGHGRVSSPPAWKPGGRGIAASRGDREVIALPRRSSRARDW